MDKHFNFLVEDTKGNNRKLKILFKKTFKFIKDIIRNEIKEEQKLTSSNATLPLSVSKKRTLLKKIYKQVLTKMGQENNIAVFLKMIDTVPESYLDYELEIDTQQAGDFVNDLIKGTGKISDNELGNLVNIVKGVGVPAISNYATGAEKLDKKTASFGAKAINKNTKEYLDSKKSRYNTKSQLAAPGGCSDLYLPEQGKSIAQIKKDLMAALSGDLQKVQNSPLSKFMGELQTSKIDISNRLPDLAYILKNSKYYKQANKLFKDKIMKVKFENQNEFDDLLNSLHSIDKEKEYVKVSKKKKKSNKESQYV